jgi:HEPN domain-containing protein
MRPPGLECGGAVPGPQGVYSRRMNRWKDWWDQSLKDLEVARVAADAGHHEWAAFAAQQAGEKALKSVIMGHGGEPWGHLLTGLTDALPAGLSVPSEVRDAARRLDKHYIPSRYPNGFASGFPGQLYTPGEAAGAIADASRLIDFCRGHLPRSS